VADYDVVVVGAGMAGQVCAAYLARDGKRVLLLEQNHHAGGNMSGFSRNGFTFDGGDQSFESLGIVFPILEDLGIYDAQPWIKARYRMVSKDFDFFIDGIDSVEAALRTAFPNEPGIRPLFEEIRSVSRFMQSVCTPWEFPLLHDFRLSGALKLLPWLRRLKRWSTFRYRETACRVIQDPQLRNWLTTIGYYKMPHLFFAGFWQLWSHDYWYPVGGMQALHDRLTARYRAFGGEVRFKTQVDRFRLGRTGRRREAQAIVTSTGEEITANHFVYAGDYQKLVEKLIGPDGFPGRTVRRVRASRLTEALVTVYLGLDMSDSELSSTLGGAHHPFFFPNYKVIFPDEGSPADVHSHMWVTLNHFGRESTAAPEGKSALTIQTYSSARWQEHWRNGGTGLPRTPAYRRLKRAVAMELISTAESLVPGLRDRVEYLDVGSPLSLERFTGNSEGSTGGWCYQDTVSPLYRSPMLNMIRTPFHNVLACGHYALWPGGVISATLCGRIVANMVAGRRALARM